MTNVTGSVAKPALQGAVARDLLQEDGEKEEEDGEARVHGERLEIPDCEVPTSEQLELQHRFASAPFVGDERRERHEAADEWDEDDGARPAEARLLDQREHDPTEPQRAKDGAEVVDAP